MPTAGRDAGHVGYRQIADDLRNAIVTGEYLPGDKVPGENELMTRFQVEQPTARRALDVLKNEGLIYARRGAGTFVREFRPIRRVSPDRLRSEVWGSGRSVWEHHDHDRRPVVDDVRVSFEKAPGHVAHVLGLDEKAQVCVRRRTYLVDNKPVQLATTYYPAAIAEGSAIAEENTGPGGAYARLSELGYGPARFREELRARMPTSDEVVALNLTQGAPVVAIVRTAFTSEDQPIELNEMVLDAHAYIIEYRFTV